MPSPPLARGGDALGAALEAIRHRGPDDRGTFINAEAGIALGQNRLSIIDLSPGGHQPMVNPANGDVLVFNGEIYNYRELRSTLAAEGAAFRSQCDTEVLLQAFARWGADCVRHIRGMYAFAVWRPATGTLHLVRDAMGIKPLYYWTTPNGGLIFASEIKAFLALPAFTARVDRRALRQFLEFGYVFEPERTVFEGVRKLPPGHRLEAQLGQPPRLQRFFRPQVGSEKSRPAGDLEEELRATLDEVVAQHLIADVPVGLLLSGGLDSSLVAALAARHAEVRTFTMAFGDSAIDERPHAAAVARHIGAVHEDIVITAQEVRDGMDQTVRFFDDIFADWGMVSTRLLYAKCRERGIKVVIVGEGSDELFGGYDVFRNSFSHAPTEWWLFQLYRQYAGRRHGAFYGAFRAIMKEYLAETGGDRFDAIRLFESRNQLPNNYVMKVDKASMSVSVEARVPFLDQRIAEVAYRIPRSALLAQADEKIALRNIARRFGLLPEATAARRKFGASIAASWMDEHAEFKRYAGDIILSRYGWTEALGLRPAMHDYFVKGRSGYPFPHAISIFRNLAWRLLILELWSHAYGVPPRGA